MTDHENPGTVSRMMRLAWRIFCSIAGALILGALVGFGLSNLWLGLAAAGAGVVAGWFFGKFVSPLDAFFSP